MVPEINLQSVYIPSVYRISIKLLKKYFIFLLTRSFNMVLKGSISNSYQYCIKIY